jgi:hypothetical protein
MIYINLSLVVLLAFWAGADFEAGNYGFFWIEVLLMVLNLVALIGRIATA